MEYLLHKNYKIHFRKPFIILFILVKNKKVSIIKIIIPNSYKISKQPNSRKENNNWEVMLLLKINITRSYKVGLMVEGKRGEEEVMGSNPSL